LVALVEADSSTGWGRTYGGTGHDRAYSVVATSDGGYAIAGYTRSFGAGESDFWLVKTDEFGYAEWNRTYGGTETDWARSLVATSDGGYAIAGYKNSASWLVKTDGLGNMEWNKTYEGEISSLVVASDGGYALAGINGYFGEPDWSDFWLVKTDEFGNAEWNKTYGGPQNERAYSVVNTSDGGYTIAGYTESFDIIGDYGNFWLVKTDAAGNVEWNQTYTGTQETWFSLVESYCSLIVTSDGGYALAGYANSFGVGYGDFWLLKIDVSGNLQWNKTYPGGGLDRDIARSVVETDDGGYAIAGETTSFGAGGFDFWLVKTDEFGNMEWSQTYGGAESDGAYSLVATSDGGYAIAGYTESVVNGDYDFWLIKTDETGYVPEYSSWLLPSILLIALLVITIYKKKLFRPPSCHVLQSCSQA
jgi:hypothetical protein